MKNLPNRLYDYTDDSMVEPRFSTFPRQQVTPRFPRKYLKYARWEELLKGSGETCNVSRYKQARAWPKPDPGIKSTKDVPVDVDNVTFVDLEPSQEARLRGEDDGDTSGGDSDEEETRIVKGFLSSITAPEGARQDRSYTSANDGTSTRQSGQPSRSSAAPIQTQPTVAHGQEIVDLTGDNEAPTLITPAITQPRDATRPKRTPLTAEQKTKLGASLKRKEAEKKAAVAAARQKTTDGGTNIESLPTSSATPSRSPTSDGPSPAQGSTVSPDRQAQQQLLPFLLLRRLLQERQSPLPRFQSLLPFLRYHVLKLQKLQIQRPQRRNLHHLT